MYGASRSVPTRSRRGSSAKGDDDVCAPVVAFRFRRWPRVVFRGDGRPLGAGARYRPRGASSLISTTDRGTITADGSRVAYVEKRPRDLCGALIGRRVREAVRGLRRRFLELGRRGRETKRDCSTNPVIPPRSSSSISDRARRGCASPSAKLPLERAILAGRSLD